MGPRLGQFADLLGLLSAPELPFEEESDGEGDAGDASPEALLAASVDSDFLDSGFAAPLARP